MPARFPLWLYVILFCSSTAATCYRFYTEPCIGLIIECRLCLDDYKFAPRSHILEVKITNSSAMSALQALQAQH